MKNILFYGIGGGYDIYVSSMIEYKLNCVENFDINPIFVNYSFSNFNDIEKYCEKIMPNLYKIVNFDMKLEYFPEGYFYQFYKNIYKNYTVYALSKTGTLPIIKALQYIINTYDITDVICVDGGVDSLMTGLEYNPGTIIEDNISLNAVSKLKPSPSNTTLFKELYCIGLGTETEEKMDMNEAMNTISKLINNGALIDNYILSLHNNNFSRYYDILSRFTWIENKARPSHIHTKINKYLNGFIGIENNIHYSFLMSMLMKFDFNKVLEYNKIYNIFDNTNTFTECLYKFTNR